MIDEFVGVRGFQGIQILACHALLIVSIGFFIDEKEPFVPGVKPGLVVMALTDGTVEMGNAFVGLGFREQMITPVTHAGAAGAIHNETFLQ
jgi:hypothetical protein